MRFDLTDEEWALLEPLMPKRRKSARVDDRKVWNAIFYVLRTGMRDEGRPNPAHLDSGRGSRIGPVGIRAASSASAVGTTVRRILVLLRKRHATIGRSFRLSVALPRPWPVTGNS